MGWDGMGFFKSDTIPRRQTVTWAINWELHNQTGKSCRVHYWNDSVPASCSYKASVSMTMAAMPRDRVYVEGDALLWSSSPSYTMVLLIDGVIVSVPVVCPWDDFWLHG